LLPPEARTKKPIRVPNAQPPSSIAGDLHDFHLRRHEKARHELLRPGTLIDFQFTE